MNILGASTQPVFFSSKGNSAPLASEKEFSRNNNDFASQFSVDQSKGSDKNLTEHQQHNTYDKNNKNSDLLTYDSINLGSENSEDLLAQRNVMKNFLGKMKGELNIQPEKLISAFSNLSDEELLSPPEESIQSLISHLNLSLEDSTKAERYFQEMLEQTNTSQIADRFQENGSALSIKVLSKKDLHNQKMQTDIQNMSHQFFVNPSKQNEQENNNKALFTDGRAQQEVLSNKDGLVPPNFFTSGGLAATSSQIGEKQVFKEDHGSLLSSNQLPKSGAENQALVENNFLFTNNLVQEPLSTSHQISPEILKSLNVSSLQYVEPTTTLKNASVTNLNSSQIFDSEGLQGTLGLEGILSENNHESAESDLLDSQNSESLYSSDGFKANEVAKDASKDFVVQSRPQLTEAQESENVNEVVNQAKVMLKNGGGEMKIQMSPHGLGEVTMKVQVENGNVKIEMLADTQEAKSLLEKGVAELKSTLASHKLNLENIKVDTSTDLMGDSAEKQQDAERQFAQQFMGEFRRNNQAWRHGFFDVSGARAYRSQTQDEAENPLLVANAARGQSGEHKRLNLVA